MNRKTPPEWLCAIILIGYFSGLLLRWIVEDTWDWLKFKWKMLRTPRPKVKWL